MTYEFEVRSILSMDHEEGMEKPRMNDVRVLLIPGRGLNPKGYFREDQLPNKEGTNALTQVLIQALVGNIRYAAENGYADAGELSEFACAKIIADIAREGRVSVGHMDDDR